MLRLLHLSDIHFKKPLCLDRRKDLDWGVRDLLVADVKSIVTTTGTPIDAVLITGDIAFQGDKEEFSVAAGWLDELTQTLGIQPENVYVVPGNHDVNRATTKSFMVDAARKNILDKTGEDRHRAFQKALSDNEARASLIKPMEEYNLFAATYDCAIPPDAPHWEHDLNINDAYTLRLNGLTSTYFSGEEDAENQLYMGAFQANLQNTAGVIHLAMFHHPFDWLSDGNEIEDALNDRAPLRLVGHMHRQRLRMSQDGSTIFAGATNPDRGEGKWSPSYNIIDVSVREEAQVAFLDIEIHQRLHQDSPEMFVARQTKAGEDIHKHAIEIPIAPKHCGQVSAGSFGLGQAVVPTTSEVTNMVPPQRNLVYRFWKLSDSQRRNIVNEMDLLTDEQLELPETERYRVAMKVVNDKGLIEQFADKINVMEKS